MSVAAEAIQTGASSPADPAAAPTPAAQPGDPAGGPTPTPSPAPTDRWQDKFLPEDLRSHEHLARYGSIEDLAKGHTETVAWARGRVPIPTLPDNPTEADRAKFERDFADFAGKVRPADAAAYKLGDADGKPTEMSEAFRTIFHEAGLHPAQAEKLNSAWNQMQVDLVSKTMQAGKDEVTAIELELGPQAFNMRRDAVMNMWEAAGIKFEDGKAMMDAIEQSQGAGAALQAMITLAERTGELAKVDGVTVALNTGAMSATAAQAELDRQNANTDKAFLDALRDPNSRESQRRAALLKRVAQSEAGGS